MTAASTRVEFDYAARVAFLDATTILIKPAPIDTLLKLLPLIEEWEARIDNPVYRAFSRVVRKIAEGDTSPVAIALKEAVSVWMKENRFVDGWIRDAAITTLFAHAEEWVEPVEKQGILPRACKLRVTPRKWYVQPPGNSVTPQAQARARRGNETTLEYGKRITREMMADERFAKGSNADNVLPPEWTVRSKFLGESWNQIAAHYSGCDYSSRKRPEKDEVGPEDIRKAVARFVLRAGLTVERLAYCDLMYFADQRL